MIKKHCRCFPIIPHPEDFSSPKSIIHTPMNIQPKSSIPSVMTSIVRQSQAILAAALFAAGSGSVLADTVIYQDSFNTPGIDCGGPFTSSLGGTAPNVRGTDPTPGGGNYSASTWSFAAETGGWGQTGAGYATPTSSNYLPFTPVAGTVYTLTATIDATASANGEWFTIGFTSSPGNWVPGNFVADLTNNLVRGGQIKTVSVTLDTTAPGWTNAQNLAYAGWFTPVAGYLNLNPANPEVKISNFSLTTQVATRTTWDAVQTVNLSDPTQVIHSGTLVGTVVAAFGPTVNGVNFSTGGMTESGGSGGGWIIPGATDPYTQLVAGRHYGGILTLQVTGLTVGQGYLFQVFANGGSGTATQTVTSGGSPSLAMPLGSASYLVGRFTADSTSRSFFLTGSGDLATYTSAQVRLMPPCTVTYDGNGNTDGTAPNDDNSPYANGSSVTVLGNTANLSKSGFTFLGWNTAADDSGTNYNPADTFAIIGDTTLHARWLANSSYAVLYNGNGNTGGTPPADPNPYSSGATATVLGNTGGLTRSGGYAFSHWNTSADGSGAPYNPADIFNISGTTTLYAQWIDVPRDLVWNNGTAAGLWNSTDANWSGATWSNGRPDNAFFTSMGGSVSLDAITAGSVNVGHPGMNFPSTSFSGTSLTATSLTVQGNGNNDGAYSVNPTLTLNVSTVTIEGDMAAGRANLTIAGGNVTAGRFITSAASADWGRLVIAGGTVTATNGVDGSVHTGATFQIDLNGGELRSPSLRVADREVGTNNDAWLTFNGGRLTVIGADNANFVTLYGGNQNCYVGAGGAVINTNSFNIGILVNLKAAGAGGLTKQGEGTLTLSGTNTYSGDTTVEAGSLVLATGGSSRFHPTWNNTSNKITGTSNPAVNLDGEIYLELAAANLTHGNSWLIVDAAHVVASYGGTFGVNSSLGAFTNDAGVWTLTQGGNVWTFTQATGQLGLQTPDAFLSWIDATWPTLLDKSPAGDPDHDGIPNLLEYVLQNGDPSVGATAILPTLTTTATDLVFTFHRRAASTADTTQTFEYSDNLTIWTPLAIPGGTGVVVTDIGGGMDEVVVTVPRGFNTTLFGRLAVTKP